MAMMKEIMHTSSSLLRITLGLMGMGLLCFVCSCLFASCANMGTPDGGRFDEEPPVVVRSTPVQGGTNVNTKKVKILFNEYVKLTNANEKVVVSPPQLEAANIRASGKYIKVTLYDSLQSNTTYTIDFSDAIEDNNEGNPMGNYTFSFSTGDVIDTMEVSGYVLNAENLEPVKGALVGLYPIDSTFNDTIFRTRPLSRVSRTNGSGKFVIKGVSEKSRYKVFALNDNDGNYIFNQKSEMIAFDSITVSTSSAPDVRMDTVWHDLEHTQFDSIVAVNYTHFYPDNIVLRAFLEEGQNLHLLKTERQTPDWFRLYFTAPMDSLPIIKGINFDESCLYAIPSLHNDTITYWVTDTAFTHTQDTLSIALTHLDTDTAGVNVYITDTLDLIPKTTYAKIFSEKKKQIDDWEKAYEKKKKRSKKPLAPEVNPYLQETLGISVKPGNSLDVNKNVTVEAAIPIARVDTNAVHLYHKKDSDWLPEPFLFEPSETNPTQYMLYAEWQPTHEYRFMIDSLAITSILGTQSKPVKQDIRVKSLDDYGVLTIHVQIPDSNVVVQLLNKSDKVLYQKRCDETNTVDFFYLRPSEYYVRCFLDRNGNDKWDTGLYEANLHPEEVFYFPKPLEVKAKWDMDQDWEPRSIKLHEQKPSAITKQKPDKEKRRVSKNLEREREKQKGKSKENQQN